MLLVLALALHRTIGAFSGSLRKSVNACWPVLVLYPLYSGVAGILQHTNVGTRFSELFASISTTLTFPLLTAFASTVVAVFVPSSGGQWIIQGFVTTQAAAAVGASAQRGLLSIGVGDQMGNLISPFWVVVGAGIARVDFRRFFGYCLIFSMLWFVLGVGIFTFLSP